MPSKNSRPNLGSSANTLKFRRQKAEGGREFAFAAGKKNSGKSVEKHGAENGVEKHIPANKFADVKTNNESTWGFRKKSPQRRYRIFSDSDKADFGQPVNSSPSAAAQTQIQPRRKDQKIEAWLLRRGHSVTFALLYAFTLVLYFRPYELIPALSAFSSIAFFLAIGTILVYIPSQLAAEGSLTARPPEINYVLLLAAFGLITVPIARSPGTAWENFNDPFLKVVLIFIVIVNVVRTEKRLLALIWLALAVGIMLSVQTLQNYSTGNFSIEGYRAMADVKGMFGNPNEQSLHFITIIPIAVALGLAAKNFIARYFYFALAVLFLCANVVTFSRGGFLGLIPAALIMAWKYGRNNRFKVMTLSAVVGLLFVALAPGNYGIRLLSIFIPGLDPVGSSSQRSELLTTSVIVTLRNPWGIGMGNFPLTNPFGLLTHNSYTQVSAEMGVLALVCYILFIFEPLRRLYRMETALTASGDQDLLYYLTVGLQASLAAFCVGSFFDAAAYQWFLYYLVAYAVCLRRVYQIKLSRQTAIAV